MLEEGLPLLIDLVRDKTESGYKCGKEDEVSSKVDDMGPPSGRTFDVEVELLKV